MQFCKKHLVVWEIWCIFASMDIMIDLETMGVGSNSVIVSIGMVVFDIESGDTYGKHYYVVDIDSCLRRGLSVSGGTIKWWLNQGDEARGRLYCAGEDLKDVLESIGHDMMTVYRGCNIWGNSARFDLGLLSDAYRACGMDIPWDFRKERDVRTLLALYPSAKEEVEMKGVAHDPIDDCLYQIEYCCLAYKNLKK